ncbi:MULTISPECIES: RHS repeat-associated core domain-containing protein [unclassified Pseudomonas]|uniref:RHS repeat-associated core domain-containing protein n=1 Tax=unclassified Pseudomonas TaxID=196821 RepID=UPI0031330C59
MTVQKLKIFYKGNKLSTLYTSSAQQTVLSANNLNLCEMISLPSQASLLGTDTQASTINMVSESQTTITYGPYGYDSTPPANTLLSRFTGQSWLPSAIGYLLGNGHRLFNPGLMRFHSPDTWSPFERGGINAYAYCTNDPINRSDPSGMFSIVKLMKGGYSVKKISSRLDQENPSLTRRQYKILKNHIATQKAKGATETKSHDNKIKNEGDQRILNATLQESILTSLTPVKIKGKTRYIGSIDLPSWEDLNDRFEKIKAVGMSDIAPTSATFSGIPNQPSHTWPRNKPPSQNLLDFTGNYINREVNRLRSIAEWP